MLPAVEAPAERTNAVDAQLMELHGDFGAGLLAGAGAVENDVAVAGDDLVVLRELVGADTNGTGNDTWIWEVVEWVAEVDDEWRGVSILFGAVHDRLEFARLKAKFANLHEEFTLLPDALGDEAKDHEDEESSGELAEEVEEGSAFLRDVTEESASEQIGFSPDNGASKIPEKKAREGHAGLAGDGSGDGAEAGDEFGEEQGYRAASAEVALGLGDAGGCLKGEAAKETQDAPPISSAQGIPEAICDDARDEDCEKSGEGADAMGCAEGTGGEQHGDAGYGDTKLLYEHPEKEDEIGVVHEEYESDWHGY